MAEATQLGTHALRFSEAELSERIHWFIRLRWLAAAGIVVATAGAVWVLRAPIDPIGLTAVAVGIALYNVLFLAWDRELSARGRSAIPLSKARLFAHVQIAADLVSLGVLLHYSGGVENPVASFFAFHMIIASILLSREMAYAQATLGTLIYAAVVGLEQHAVLSHVPLGLFASPDFYRSDNVWLVVATQAATLYLLVYMATAITGRLRRREQEAAELADQLAQKAAELEKAYDDLKATQKLQITYMRKTSHELRSPLAAVASSLDVVAEGLTGDVPPKQKEMVDRARVRVRQLRRLVDDLLTLLRSRAAPPRERFEPVGMEHVIDGVVSLLADRADQEQVELTADMLGALPPVCGDHELLTQLITNLVANAVKYTPPGGSVRVEADADDAAVLLRVSDTGVGISEEELPRIFDEFYRAKTARNFTTKGTGLGLSIVKSIADAHGAGISVKSEPGKGTTFTVRLPRYDPELGTCGQPAGPAADS
jgi:signal transduction histidine kinase